MHEHRDENVKKLEAGLPYLLKHNREHVKEMKKWIERARQARQDGVAEKLKNVLGLSMEITGLFEAALDELGITE